MTKYQKNQSGFTLLELSIVLVIIGVLLIPSLNFLSTSQKSTRVIQTRKDLKTIYDALSLFYKSNQRLPQPADITLVSTDANYGTEDASPLLVDGTSVDIIEYGAIPVEALNLSYQYIADAWGNKYSYYVRKNVTDTTMGFGDMKSTTDIYIHDQNIGRDDVGTAFVIISHGEDGAGAYPKDSEAATIAQNPYTGVFEPSDYETQNIYSASKVINATSSNRLVISDGGINDISIGSTGRNIINEIMGDNGINKEKKIAKY